MPSARRLRSITFTAIIAALILIYVTTGPTRTQESEFYTRTLALMKDRGRLVVDQALNPTKAEPPVPEHEADAAFKFDSALQATSKGHNKPAQAPPQAVFRADAKLKERLKHAEQMAKHSADEKYKALQDVEKAIQESRDARAAAYGADAPEAQDEAIASVLGQDGVEGREFMAPAPSAASDGDSRHAPEASDKADAPGDAEQELANILDKSPVVIFSKTYCPFSKKAKKILLDDFTIKPTPYVVELDQHWLGGGLQALLGQKTGRRTVPNILINGKSQGGGDEMAELEDSGKLREHFLKASKGKIGSVEEKPKHTADPQAVV